MYTGNEALGLPSTWRNIENLQRIDTKASTEIFVVARMSILDMALEVVFPFKPSHSKFAPRIRTYMWTNETMLGLPVAN